MAALGGSMFGIVGVPRHVMQVIMGGTGIVLGLWPSVACAIGVFRPGPFTSPWWAATAVLTAAWFLVLGLRLAVTGVRGARAQTPSVESVT